MKYLELSLKNVEDASRKLYVNKIKKNYDYDLVIFIAKGGYIIGQTLANEKSVPLIEIIARRKGVNLKKIVKPLFKIIPKKILIKLREKEINSTYHEVKKDRKVQYNESIYNKHLYKKKILLVDDSIDSGYSIIETKKIIKRLFKKSEIKIAVFNTMSKSVIKPDFTLYKDTMINGPWSNDSKYHLTFLEKYNDWKKDYEG